MCLNFTGHSGEILRICGCEIAPVPPCHPVDSQRHTLNNASEPSGRRRVTSSGESPLVPFRDGPAAGALTPCLEPCMGQGPMVGTRVVPVGSLEKLRCERGLPMADSGRCPPSAWSLTRHGMRSGSWFEGRWWGALAILSHGSASSRCLGWTPHRQCVCAKTCSRGLECTDSAASRRDSAEPMPVSARERGPARSPGPGDPTIPGWSRVAPRCLPAAGAVRPAAVQIGRCGC